MEYRTLNPGDTDYPRKLRDRLGKDAPTLYARGRIENLSRWNFTFLTSDDEPMFSIEAVWGMMHPVMEFEMNAIGPWQSVSEGVLFRSILFAPWISLTLFTAKGLQKETYESFIDDREPDRSTFGIYEEHHERRVEQAEYLMLSVSLPDCGRQSSEVVLRRNWIACHLADIVWIGAAEPAPKVWYPDKKAPNHGLRITPESSKGELRPRRSRTFALARRLVKTGIPVFTVDHPDNRDLLDLGIRGFKPETIGPFLESLGARKVGDVRPGKTPRWRTPPTTEPPAPPAPPPAPVAAPQKARTTQLGLFGGRGEVAGRLLNGPACP